MLTSDSFLDDIVEAGIENLGESDQALGYLEDRGVDSKQIDAFQIGYFPPDHDYEIETSSSEVYRFERKFPSLSFITGKVILPVKDPLGNIVGLHTRSPSHENKDYMKFYLQSSKSSPRFFGVEQAMPSIWETGEVYICEGLFDLFPLQRIHSNTICTLTAKISYNQTKFLKRFADTVKFAFDNDEQGEDAYEEFKMYNGSDFERIDKLKYHEKDLSEFWSSVGEDQFRSVIEQQ